MSLTQVLWSDITVASVTNIGEKKKAQVEVAAADRERHDSQDNDSSSRRIRVE